MIKIVRHSGWFVVALGVAVLCTSTTLSQSGRVKRKPEEAPPPAANSNANSNDSKPKGPEMVDGPNGKEIVYKSGDVDRKAVIRKRPEARYSRRARDRGVQGRVIVSMVLSSTGLVTNIRIVRGVPELNESAIEAAKQIEFEPAIKDGKPVATRVAVEYTFMHS